MHAGDVVSLRVATAAGPTEIVGTLVAASPTTLTVRRRDGRTVEVAVDDIRAGRVVPPGPARTVGADELQAVMAEGWRAEEVERTAGGWLLRAAGGFTGRANSALVTAPALPDAAAALAEVTRWYGDRGLPAQLQVVVGGAPPGLEELLTAQGWQRSAPVHAMTAEAAHVLRAATPPLPGAPPVDVRLDAAPDDGWLACYRPDEAPLTEHGLHVLTRHPHVAFASVRDAGGGCRAITRVAVDGRWAGLHAVEVRPDARRQSLGTSLAVAAVRWAVGEGARRVYLQVRADNDAGLALWTRLGFAVHHDYVYWTAPHARLT